ncbi:MAG: ABC transporter permease subunit [Rhizobiales bacterium]|nr:ABC transporter permease subunit [Hyphomicrobiales bacterium]
MKSLAVRTRPNNCRGSQEWQRSDAMAVHERNDTSSGGPGGIALVYGLALLGLASVAVSLLGNILASFSDRADIGHFTLLNYGELLGEHGLGDVTLRTLMLGVGSVSMMLFFGFPIAWILSRTDFAWKRMTIGVLVAKLAIPGFITAMSYVWLLNPTSGLVNRMFGATALGAEPVFNIYGLGWICLLQGAVLVPACVFLMLPAFQHLDATLEEAAWVSGVSPARTIRRVVLPLLAPAVLGAAMFFFVISVETFDIVGLIGLPGGIKVLSVWIYDAMHPAIGMPDYGFAAAVGILLFLMSAVAIGFYIYFVRRSERYAVVAGKGRSSPPQSLGLWRWPALAFVCGWAFIAFVLPLVTLIWVALVPYLQVPSSAALKTLSLTSFNFALSYIGTPLLNTSIVAAGAILLALTWGASISWVVTRSGTRTGLWLDTAVFLSPAVPSMVAAVAFQYLGIALYRWLPIYGTIWLISLAIGTRLLAFCTRTINAASWQIHRQLDEAAYVSGVSRLKTFRYIYLPIIAPSLFYSSAMVGLLSVRELTVPLIIDAGKAPVVSTLVFQLQTNGNHNVAAAVAIYMIALLVALVFIASRLSGADRPAQSRRQAQGRSAERREPVPLLAAE